MAEATRHRETPNGTTKPALSLVEMAIEQTVNEKVRQVDQYLTADARIAEIEALLPDFMKGQAARLAKRARLTFAGSEKLQKCTPASFVKCVLQAAELGFAIDGRLCHAVPYANKKKDGAREYWVDEAQCQVDYKGLIAVAKRLKLVQDVWARRVCLNDHFLCIEQDGKTHYEHSFDHKKERGEVDGVYAVATHADGWFRVEWMPIAEIHAIRARSKSFSGKGTSPWTTDPGEMEKKTVIKRLLKTFSDDPGLIRLLELDDQDTDLNQVIAATERQQVTAETLRTSLRPRTVVEPPSRKVDDPGPDEPEQPVDVAHDPTVTSEPHVMSDRDKFRAECAECELTGAVDLVVEKWLGEGSARELSTDDAAEMRMIAKERQQQIRDARGKK